MILSGEVSIAGSKHVPGEIYLSDDPPLLSESVHEKTLRGGGPQTGIDRQTTPGVCSGWRVFS